MPEEGLLAATLALGGPEPTCPAAKLELEAPWTALVGANLALDGPEPTILTTRLAFDGEPAPLLAARMALNPGQARFVVVESLSTWLGRDSGRWNRPEPVQDGILVMKTAANPSGSALRAAHFHARTAYLG